MSTRPSSLGLFKWAASALATGAIVFSVGDPPRLRAQQPDPPSQTINLQGAQTSVVVTPIPVNVDLSTLPKVEPWAPGDKIQEESQAQTPGASQLVAQGAPTGAGALSAYQSADALADTPAEFSNPTPNFDGIAFTGFIPPDTNGDVGPNHYVQQANRSVQIFDKTGTSLAGPFSTASLWSAVGGLCSQNNPDDVLANYDPLADRFLVSHFVGLSGPTFHQCIAVSQGPDPVTSGWYLYDFVLPASNDYPKISVWPDAYYMSSQRGFPGGGLDVYALDRANMLNGNPATFQTFAVGSPSLVLLPSDVDGAAPAFGTPNFFVRQVDGDIWGGADRLEVFEFHVDWGNPAASTFTGPAAIPVAAFSAECGGGGGLNHPCVTQPGTAQGLDSLSPWTMWRLQYRNFGTYEAMVTDHTVDVDGADHAGVRWYELRRAGGGAWSLYQQGTFAPDGGAPGLADDPHRFMGSIAMDKAGNIAVGYAVSVDSPDDTRDVQPGIRYAGRLATDPLGLLPHGEVTLFPGAGVQTGSLRYGDYSAMQVDPVDGCTFWYTQEYIAAGGNWATRIGAFRFPSCNQADLRISKIDSPDPVNAGGTLSYSVTVTNDGPSPATDVVVVDTLPAGVTYVTSTDSCVQAPVGTLTCTLGSIAANASKNFTIQVTVGASVPNGTVLTNTAVVSGHEEDPNTANNTASATTIVNTQADLLVTKVCKPDGPAPAGTNGTCTILVTNLGPSDAQNVVLTDTLVANGPFTIVSATFTPPGAACAINNVTHVVTCNLGTEPAGGTTTIVVTVTSAEAVDVNDVAVVTSTTPDPNLSNNQAQGQIHFTGVANLAITKTDSPDPVVAGTNLTWVITVTNAGPSTATNTVVQDVLPGEVQVLSVTPSVGSCQGGIPGNPAAPMTCTLGSVAVGDSPTITIVARVLANTPQGATVHNNVRVASGVFDPDNANNVASSFTLVLANGDLAITKTSDAPVYKPSSIVTYTITVTNNGPSDSLGVVVTDQLPTTRQAIYQSDTGGCTLSGLVLTCPMGNLTVGQSKYVNVYVLVRGNRGPITNTATVSAQTTDPAAGNNTAVLVVQVK
jgi:uncharacterized repeat protein (TIGR01451 family)